LGALADLLLRSFPLGANIPLWTAALVAAMVWLARREGMPLTLTQVALMAVALLFATGIAWRDSRILKLVDASAVAIALSLAAARTSTARNALRRASLTEYARTGAFVGFSIAIGTLPLIVEDIHWRRIPRATWGEQSRSVAAGVLIAAPLLLGFNALFMSADKAYEETVKSLLQVDFEAPFRHLLVILGAAWCAAGFLRVLTPLPAPRWSEMGPSGCTLRLGLIEVCIPLVLLDMLFACFIGFQLPYLFGGHGLVQDPAGPTYAEYARRGFFELVAVAALTLPLLLGSDWLLRDRTRKARALFRLLAGIMVVLLLILMVSAFHRMSLYLYSYGLTELRFYSTAFMIWLALLTLWFAATALPGRRERFAFGALMTGLAAIALLHIANPDAYIARTNLARMHTGRGPDMEYLSSLSADAIPTVVAALVAPGGDPSQRNRRAAAMLFARIDHLDQRDWRTWNWGRMQAKVALDRAWNNLPVVSRTELQSLIAKLKEDPPQR